jgi:hypothetical protein
MIGGRKERTMPGTKTRLTAADIQLDDRILHPDIPNVIGEVDRIVIHMTRGRPAEGTVTVFYPPITHETYRLPDFDAIGFTRA